MCMCKDCKANTWWWFWLHLLLLYQCTTHISDLGFNRLDWYEEHFTTNPLPKALSRFRAKFDEFYSGRSFQTYIFHIIVLDETRQNLLEYMEVFIPHSRGSQHLPIWAASDCRTMPYPLWRQHNSSLVFGHMRSPQYNSVQSFKSCAGVKMMEPILVMLCDSSGWWFF